MRQPHPTPATKTELEAMPWVAHLLELRRRLLAACYGIAAMLVLLAFWPGPNGLLDFLAQPLRAHLPVGTRLIAVDVFAPFFVPLKVLLLAALVLSLPWCLFQIWRFVAPGLYAHEKRLIVPLLVLGSLLAYAGMAFVQYFVLDKVFAFLVQAAPQSVQTTPDIASYVQTVLELYLAFALAFQVPVVVMVLIALGVCSVAQLRRARGYFVVGAFVVAAILTPPDVLSQLALALPMCVLYELGLWGGRWYRRPPSLSL
jgi:sec-independent protein translocase protein TatC